MFLKNVDTHIADYMFHNPGGHSLNQKTYYYAEIVFWKGKEEDETLQIFGQKRQET